VQLPSSAPSTSLIVLPGSGVSFLNSTPEIEGASCMERGVGPTTQPICCRSKQTARTSFTTAADTCHDRHARITKAVFEHSHLPLSVWLREPMIHCRSSWRSGNAWCRHSVFRPVLSPARKVVQPHERFGRDTGSLKPRHRLTHAPPLMRSCTSPASTTSVFAVHIFPVRGDCLRDKRR